MRVWSASAIALLLVALAASVAVAAAGEVAGIVKDAFRAPAAGRTRATRDL